MPGKTQTSLAHPEEDGPPHAVPDAAAAASPRSAGVSRGPGCCSPDPGKSRGGCSGESAADSPSGGCGDGGGELDGRDAPRDDVRLWPNRGSSGPEMWLTLLGRTTETAEVPSTEVEGPRGGKVNGFIVLTFSWMSVS